MFNLFAVLFVCAVFGSVQSVPMSAELRNVETWRCLNSLNLTAESVDFLKEYYGANCNNGPQTSVCKFALKTFQSFRMSAEKDTVSGHPSQKSETPSTISDGNQTFYSNASLNVYNLFEIHPFIKLLRCVEPDVNLKALYFTSISYRGNEYYYGRDGISKVPDGQSSFGSTRKQVLLDSFSVKEMKEYIENLAENEFTPKKYDLFTNNCNSFTNTFASIAIYGHRYASPYSYQETVTELAQSPLGGWVMLYQDKLKFTLN